MAENILLSKYSAEFLRNIKDHFKANIDIKFYPQGSLLLASDKYADKLEHNIALQREHGINNRLLTVDEINNKYPWVNTSDIKLGKPFCYYLIKSLKKFTIVICIYILYTFLFII